MGRQIHASVTSPGANKLSVAGRGRHSRFERLDCATPKQLAELLLLPQAQPLPATPAQAAPPTRAYGKPAQFNTGDAQSFKKAIEMTDDELAAIVGRAKLTVV